MCTPASAHMEGIQIESIANDNELKSVTLKHWIMRLIDCTAEVKILNKTSKQPNLRFPFQTCLRMQTLVMATPHFLLYRNRMQLFLIPALNTFGVKWTMKVYLLIRVGARAEGK